MLGQNRKKGEENKKRKSTAAKEQKKNQIKDLAKLNKKNMTSNIRTEVSKTMNNKGVAYNVVRMQLNNDDLENQ